MRPPRRSGSLLRRGAPARTEEVLERRWISVEQTKADQWKGALPTSIYAGAPIPFLNVGAQ